MVPSFSINITERGNKQTKLCNGEFNVEENKKEDNMELLAYAKKPCETYSFNAAFPTGGWENVIHLTATFSFSFDKEEAEITLKIARVANAATYKINMEQTIKTKKIKLLGKS